MTKIIYSNLNSKSYQDIVATYFNPIKQHALACQCSLIIITYLYNINFKIIQI